MIITDLTWMTQNGGPTVTINLVITSSDDLSNLQSMLGKNVTITEVNERPYQYYRNTTSGSIGDTKNERILKPGPEAIPIRQVQNCIGELDLED